MAKNDNDRKRQNANKNIVSQLKILRDRMNSVYRDTYSTEPNRQQNLDALTDDIETAVSNIMNRSSNDISGISKMYTKIKLDKVVSDKKYTDSIVGYFENNEVVNQLITTYMDNRWIKELDMEIDTVCKYMPKLEDALDAIKDAVLSADNFEKEFVSFESPEASPSEISKFSKKMSLIKEAYNAEDAIERWYCNTSKYGETFIYNVPYSKAVKVLLDRKDNPGRFKTRLHESVSILNENSYIGSKQDLQDLRDVKSIISQNKITLNNDLKVEIYNGGLLESAINEATDLRKLLPISESMGVMEQASLLDESGLDKTIPDKLEIPKALDGVSSDGLITATKASKDEKIKIPGVLLKELEHANVIMLYMHDVCLGYYYMEFLNSDGNDIYQETVFRKKSGYLNSAKDADKQNQNTAVDNVLKFVSSKIIDQIDSKFVNANPDLAKEIYAILDYNDFISNSEINTIRMTFIPPQDIEHIKFNEDPKTHRGISDLARSLIPAKLWVCLYITYSIGILTRGQDKRVYYVKQSVEQNIAQTLLNVIEQIKKNNFNIMQIENMNSILNMTGQFNDYVIPVGMSGDAPISMEVMQGQEINPQTELMDKLEESAINGTNCPIELLTARLQLDFATQLTMSNNKFMRFVYKRQTKFEKSLSNIFTKIYNVENDDDNYLLIRCVLPSPLLLNMSNLTQILQQVNEQAQTLAQMEYTDDDADSNKKRQLFIKHYVKLKLGSYLKQNELEMVKNNVELEIASSNNNTDNNDSDGY